MTHVTLSTRHAWRRERQLLEARLRSTRLRSTMDGDRRHQPAVLTGIVKAAEQVLRLTGLHARARRNAVDLRVVEVDFAFPDLPPAFDGYRLLHLSDLHVDDTPSLHRVWRDRLAGVEADLVAITGNIQSQAKPPAAEAALRLAPLMGALTPADGVVAVLGNHDEAALVEELEKLGIEVLVNQGRTLARGGQHIHLVGTDDVHCFYTPAAKQALTACRDGFRIALVHTVDLVDQAESLGYALYLSGHTHGGQIALPGGRPLVTALDRHRRLAKGAWRHGRLCGHTSPGTGTGHPALRLNTRPEATLIRLVRG